MQLQYFSQQQQHQKTIKSNFNSDESALLSSEEDDFPKTTSPPKLPSQTSNSGNNNNDDVRLQVSRYIGTNRTSVAILDVYPDPGLNTTQITISCMNFLFGGTYELEIVGGNDVDESANALDNRDERLRQQLDVKWPQPKLSVTTDSIGTYPQQPVDVILEFPGIECNVPHTHIDHVPEFTLELYFCGHEVYCDNTNVSSSQILYAEQIGGYPKARLIKLSCELFGLAGHYVVKLRPSASVAASVSATAYILVNRMPSLSLSTYNIVHIWKLTFHMAYSVFFSLHSDLFGFSVVFLFTFSFFLVFFAFFHFFSYISLLFSFFHFFHIFHCFCFFVLFPGKHK